MEVYAVSLKMYHENVHNYGRLMNIHKIWIKILYILIKFWRVSWGWHLLQLCNVRFVPVLIKNIFVLHSFSPVKTPRYFLQTEGAVIQGDSDGSQRQFGELTGRLETSRSPNWLSWQLWNIMYLSFSFPIFIPQGNRQGWVCTSYRGFL